MSETVKGGKILLRNNPAPKLSVGAEFYLTHLFELITQRNSDGLIPILDIHSYAQIVQIEDVLMFQKIITRSNEILKSKLTKLQEKQNG